MSGLMSVTGTDTSGPLRTGVAMADVSAGMNLAIVVLMALYERQRTQQGQWVTTSLLESTLAMMDFQVARWLHDGQEPERVGNDHPTLMPTGVVHTQDGTITQRPQKTISSVCCVRCCHWDHWISNPSIGM